MTSEIKLTKAQKRLLRLIDKGSIKYLHNLHGAEWITWRFLLDHGFVACDDQNKLSVTKPNP